MPKALKKTTKTVADFRAANDPAVIIPNKIRATLAEMEQEGPEQWEYEADFCRRAGIGPSVIGAYRTEFEKHIVATGGSRGARGKLVWFATTKAAAKARGE